MAAAGTRSQLRLLVTVKAYPTISLKYAELVCCAGITEHREWVRLYPVPFRTLPDHCRFDKYDIIDVDVERREQHKDNRPQSWRPILETMTKVGHLDTKAGSWDARLDWIAPTVLHGYAHMLELQQKENCSLGAFRPSKVLGVDVKRESGEWTEEEKASIHQAELFHEIAVPLEKIPFRFRVGFTDEIDKEHWLSVIDWEFMQLWRKERDRLGDDNAAADSVRLKIEAITGPAHDTIFFTGNLGDPRKRRTFVLLGFAYPKRTAQGSLF